MVRGRPRLGAFVGLIDGILAADADPSTPRKQRHTARWVFERLRDEHGYAGSEVTVRRYVAEQGRRGGEVFVPLSQPAGEAQFDFGEATVEIARVRVKAALAVMTLPYSDAFLVSAYPRECTETFQAGHVCELEFLEREKRAAERRLKAARFPTMKTLEGFDFTARPSVNKLLVAELTRCG